MYKILKWDGSEITDILEETIKLQMFIDGIIYWRIEWKDGSYVYCEVKNYNNTLPVIIDEIKPIFGITKNGTHWIKIGNKIKMLINVEINKNNEIQKEYLLNQIDFPFDNNKLFVKQVQEIFTFRELLGIPKTFESSIKIRTRNKYTYPISYNEPYMKPEKYNPILSPRIIEKWFNDINVNDVVKRMLHINCVENIPIQIFTIRNGINDVINRIDKDSITYTDFIIERILNRIQSFFL